MNGKNPLSWMIATFLLGLTLSACSLLEPTPTARTAGPSAFPLASAVEPDLEAAAIREFINDPGLVLRHTQTTTHPENTALIVEVYEAADTEFMVDAQNHRVMFMQMHNPGSIATGSESYSVQQLELQARDFISSRNRCFDQLEPYLEFRPGSKVDNHFFRWQSPAPDPHRLPDAPPFVQVSVRSDGLVFAYVDAAICQLDAAWLAQITPTPEPTDTPATAPRAASGCALTPAPTLSGDYAGWSEYTNARYGFALYYPPGWTLQEEANPISTLYGHLIHLHPPQGTPAVMTIAFKVQGEDIFIGRTGVGAGEFLERGTVSLLGQELRRDLLVCQGTAMTVLYHNTSATECAKLVFALSLDYIGDCNSGSGLPEVVQTEADLIIASVRLTY